MIAGEAAHLQCATNLQCTQPAQLTFMKRFIVNASKGLVEWVGGPTAAWDPAHHFQFIHESVRQHVITGGLRKLNLSLVSNVKANCAALLVGWCGTSFRKSDANGVQRLVMMNSDFLHYAQRSVWGHLYTAYAEKAYDLKCLHDFPLQQFIRLAFVILPRDSALESSASLLHVLLDPGARFRANAVTHDLVRDLFEHCSRCSSTVQNGRTSMSCSEFLLGRDLNDYCGGRYSTPLIAAISTDSVDLIALLLDAGADVNVCSGGRSPPSSIPEEDLWSPLSAAGSSTVVTNLSTVKLLLDRGADVNIRSKIHGSALGAAAFQGQDKIVRLLLDRGADVNLEDSEGRNIALREAVSRYDNIKIVEMLVCAGAYVKPGSLDRVMFKTPCGFY